jgi:hypothetical protein
MANAERGARSVTELTVKVSEKNSITQYGFAYDDEPENPNNEVIAVVMNHGEGEFRATSGTAGRLIWGMHGEAGGTMKVEILHGTTVIKSRQQSRIVPPETRGADFLNISVP